MGVTPEQLAEWRGLCEAAFLGTEHLGQLKRATAKLLDALEAQTRATAKWVDQHDAVLEASLARDTRLSMVEANRDRLRDDLAEVSAERDRLRLVVSKVADAIGNGSSCSQEASLDFMEVVPDEVRLEIKLLKFERDRLAARVAELEAAKLEVGECPKHSWMGRVRGSKSTCPHCKIEGRQ